MSTSVDGGSAIGFRLPLPTPLPAPSVSPLGSGSGRKMGPTFQRDEMTLCVGRSVGWYWEASKVSLGQPAMQKREHQSFAISTGCYLAQMVHIIDYPVTAAAAGRSLAKFLLLRDATFIHAAAVGSGAMSGYPPPDGHQPSHKMWRLTEITNEHINLPVILQRHLLYQQQQQLQHGGL